MRPSGSRGFVERSLAGFLDQLEYATAAEDAAAGEGVAQRLAQSLDPRVKVACCAALIISAVIMRRPEAIAALFVLAAALALAFRIPVRKVLTRAWIAVLFFTGAIALPAVFLTPGAAIARLPGLNWAITAQGVTTAARLIARAETTATFSLLLVFTTPWVRVLKSLRMFGLPVVFVVILGMTYRYIFVLVRSACEMFEARRSRMVGELGARDRRRITVNSLGALLGRTFQLSGDVYLAMQARGYRGEVYLLDNLAMHGADWLVLSAGIAASAAAMWLGR